MSNGDDSGNLGQTRANRKTSFKLVLVTMIMFGFGFALVPLYDAICNAFGIGKFVDIEKGTYDVSAQIKKANTMQADLNRTITIEFITTMNRGMNWDFKPVVNKMDVHPGEIKVVNFYAKNNTGQKVIAQAIPRIQPARATKYFSKMECFCFTQQTFGEGEAREMPLRFVVDPALPKNIKTITLSYTFFDTQGPKKLEQVSNNQEISGLVSLTVK